jgi:hypothetical protein
LTFGLQIPAASELLTINGDDLSDIIRRIADHVSGDADIETGTVAALDRNVPRLFSFVKISMTSQGR